MYGAVFGDIIGSWYEWHNKKSEDIDLFPREARFTDDTVLTVAVAESILHMENNSPRKCYANHIKAYYRRYPGAGFGNMFKDWATSDHLSVQHSYGNGASMRVSAIGWAFDDEKEILRQVSESCHYTHNNKEAVRCAQAVAIAVFMARNGASKEDIKARLEKNFKINEVAPAFDIFKLWLKQYELPDLTVYAMTTSSTAAPTIQFRLLSRRSLRAAITNLPSGKRSRSEATAIRSQRLREALPKLITGAFPKRSGRGADSFWTAA